MGPSQAAVGPERTAGLAVEEQQMTAVAAAAVGGGQTVAVAEAQTAVAAAVDGEQTAAVEEKTAVAGEPGGRGEDQFDHPDRRPWRSLQEQFVQQLADQWEPESPAGEQTAAAVEAGTGEETVCFALG